MCTRVEWCGFSTPTKVNSVNALNLMCLLYVFTLVGVVWVSSTEALTYSLLSGLILPQLQGAATLISNLMYSSNSEHELESNVFQIEVKIVMKIL